MGEPLLDIDVEEPMQGEGGGFPATFKAENAPLGQRGGKELGRDLPSCKPAGKDRELEGEDPQAKVMAGVYHLARINKVDIAKIHPTGASGQVTKEDVIRSVNASRNDVSQDQSTPTDSVDSFEVVSPNPFQRAMIRSMNAALKIPHFGYHDEVDVSKILQLRDDLAGQMEPNYGIQITLMPFLIKALSLSLAKYPILNSHFDPDNGVARLFKSHNITMAVDTEHGLAVPVIHSVQKLSVIGVAKEIERLSTAARTNRLTSNDQSHGSIAVSNIGSIGGTTVNPVIVPPQVTIVAFGRWQLLPRYDGGTNQLVARRIMPISWSADHRVVDGATIARFCQYWKSLLETPSTLMLHLTPLPQPD